MKDWRFRIFCNVQSVVNVLEHVTSVASPLPPMTETTKGLKDSIQVEE